MPCQNPGPTRALPGTYKEASNRGAENRCKDGESFRSVKTLPEKSVAGSRRPPSSLKALVAGSSIGPRERPEPTASVARAALVQFANPDDLSGNHPDVVGEERQQHLKPHDDGECGQHDRSERRCFRSGAVSGSCRPGGNQNRPTSPRGATGGRIGGRGAALTGWASPRRAVAGTFS